MADQERYERATRVLDEIYPAWREKGTDASKMPGPLGDFARTCFEHCYTDAWGRAEGSGLDHKTRSLITMTALATLGIDALGLIMKENGLSNDDIEHVETTLGPIAHMAVGSHANPADLQEGRFSLEYLLGEVLLNGGIDVHTFERHEKLDDPEHKDAAAKVSHKMDKEQPFQYPGAEVVVTKKGGETITKRLDGWIGNPEYPLDVEQIRSLCRPYLEVMLDKTSCDRVEEIVLGLDEQPDVLELMDILTFARGGRRRGSAIRGLRVYRALDGRSSAA